MRIPAAVYMMLALGITLGLSTPVPVSAQVPVQRQPRATQPAPAAPVAQTPGQPTVAPAAAAPAEPAPVTAPPPSGVTQLPPAAAPPTTASSSSAATAKGYYSAANFLLNLEGSQAATVYSVEGGAAVADVVVVKAGPDNIAKKHTAGVKYEELSFDVGIDATPVIEWIASTWQGKSSRKSGSVQLTDPNYNVMGEREFTNALITATTVSALGQDDAKKALRFRVTVAPEYVRETANSGKGQALGNKAKQAMASNFRLELGDLETNYINRIDPFTVGQKVVENQVGLERLPVKGSNTLEFPNLKITMPGRPIPNWSRWYQDFVIKGNNGDDQEKNGAIVFMDPSLKIELGRINLFNCGIFRLGSARQDAASAKTAAVTADLYCERMELAIKP